MDFLAQQLANNYFDVTFGYPPKAKSLQEDYRKVFRDKARDYRAAARVRNVLLVGAGVSFAAFGGELFPLAEGAIDALRKSLGVRGLRDALGKFDSGDPTIPDRFAEEEQMFRQLHGVKDPRYDFETQLAILSKFYTPRQIRGALSKIYDLRHYPHITFETIAHLLKHRFLDVVINYNFDEVLDQAILEEVRGGDSKYVISDGDAVDLSTLVVTDTLKVPLYIKPHGTITHKSTLRFTKDHYVGMPSDLYSFTKKILLGNTREDPRQQRDKYYVNLISIGFAFTSVELIELLRDHPRLRVFHVNLETGDHPSTLHEQVREIGEVEQYFIGIDPRASQTESSESPGTWPTIAAVLRELFQRTHDMFNDVYRPRQLSRHEVVHALLFREGPPKDRTAMRKPAPAWPAGAGVRVPKENRDYLYARLCVEIAIALAKGNGRIDLSTLVDDRVGIYFGKWRECETRGVASLRTICTTYFKLRDDRGYGGNIFTIPPVRDLFAPDEQLRTALAEWDANEGMMEGTSEFAYGIWLLLREALQKIDDPVFQAHLDAIGKDFGKGVVSFLARLVHSDVQELAPRFTPESQLLLNVHSREAVIHTQLGMNAKYMKMLEDPRWDLLLSISELGKVLRKVPEHLWTASGRGGKIRKASIIVADPHDPAILEERLGDYRARRLVIGQDYRLPYWAHNDHMFVTLRMGLDRGDFEPLAAIWYRLPGLENRMNAVYIEDPDDLDMLVRTYFGGVTKAEAYMLLDREKTDADATSEVVRGQDRGGVPDVDAERAAETRRILEAKWWDAMFRARTVRGGGSRASAGNGTRRRALEK